MSVSVDSDRPTFEPGVPRVLLGDPAILFDPDAHSYVVSRDGRRFLVNTVLPEFSSPIHIVVNWTPERKR